MLYINVLPRAQQVSLDYTDSAAVVRQPPHEQNRHAIHRVHHKTVLPDEPQAVHFTNVWQRVQHIGFGRCDGHGGFESST